MFTVKKILFIILFCLIIILFISCDPATGISVTNRTIYNVFIEYEFNEFDIPYNDYTKINNNFNLNSGETESIIHLFPNVRIIAALGFGNIKKEEDIILAINSIFNWINVYKLTDEGKTLIYDKTYFMDKNNFKWHKYPPGNYSIEFIIK
jgi:hypothetical protein